MSGWSTERIKRRARQWFSEASRSNRGVERVGRLEGVCGSSGSARFGSPSPIPCGIAFGICKYGRHRSHSAAKSPGPDFRHEPGDSETLRLDLREEDVSMRIGKRAVLHYDRERLEPALRCSICTGEQVAGFLEKGSHHFEEVMLIRNDADLRSFCEQYGLTEPPRKFY